MCWTSAQATLLLFYRSLLAEATVRLIVVDDLSTLDEVEPRLVNDYGVLVGPNGVEQIYKM